MAWLDESWFISPKCTHSVIVAVVSPATVEYVYILDYVASQFHQSPFVKCLPSTSLKEVVRGGGNVCDLANILNILFKLVSSFDRHNNVSTTTMSKLTQGF